MIASVFLQNDGMDQHYGDWIELPMGKNELLREMKRLHIDVDRGIGYIIADVEVDDENRGVQNIIKEYTDIVGLNEQLAAYEALDEDDRAKTNAILLMDEGYELNEIMDNLDNFVFFPEVKDEEDLGRAYFDMIFYKSQFDSSQTYETMVAYFDYASFGRDAAINEGGKFTDLGYVAKIW